MTIQPPRRLVGGLPPAASLSGRSRPAKVLALLASAAIVLSAAGCGRGGGMYVPPPADVSGSATPVGTGGPDGTDASAETSAPARPGSAALVAHSKSGRYAISAPRSWTVSQDANGRVIVEGEGTRITTWPFFTAQRSFSAGTASAALSKWEDEVAPDASFDEPSAEGDAVVARGTAAHGEAVATLAWRSGTKGTAGQAAIVESGDLADALPVASSILDSFVPEGAPASASDGDGGDGDGTLTFDTWRDPAEGAFSADVPSGWTVSGGTVRPSLELVQSSIQLSSPDGAIHVYLGDAFGVYVEPNQTLAFAGLGEGDKYTDQNGDSWPIMSYRPGAKFLTDVLFPEQSTQVTVTKAIDRPDLAASLPTTGINRFAAGEVEYSVGDRVGDAICVTEEIASGIGGMWHPWRVLLASAPPDRRAEASVAVTRLVSSFTIDPTWAARQAQTTAEQSRILTEQNAAMSKSISDGYWGKVETMDAISVRRERANLDVVDLTDPDTGSDVRVDAGYDYYWVGPDGTVVGTDTSAKPDVSFRELLQLP